MSRSSNRGPRADIALLRKLKADPNFSPASLLNEGPNFLEKANKLKGFVAEQRGKLGASSAKTEWLLAYQHLQGEQDDAERELLSYLQQLADQGPQQGSELRDVADAVSTLQSQTDACRAERLRLRSELRGMSAARTGYKASGASYELVKDPKALKGEMSSKGQKLQATLAALAEQVQALTSQLRDVWPSALAGPGSEGLGLGLVGASVVGPVGASVDGAVAPAYSRAEDREELERMMARYPLASPDIKDRIREVFQALQEKYMERLETWRLEADQAARNLTDPFSSVTAPTASSLAHLPRRPHHPAVSAASASTAAPLPRVPAGSRSSSPAAGTAAAAGRGLGARSVRGSIRPPGSGSPGPPQQQQQFQAALEPGEVVAMSGDAGANPRVSGVASGASWVFAGCGGWSAEEHSAFVRHRDRLMKECGQVGTKATTREALMSRIAGLLPGGRSVAEVVAHDDWTTAARILARKRRDLAEGWERELRQFLEDSSSFLEESAMSFFVQAEEAADRLVAELHRERARDELEELRAERARDEEVAAAERAARQAAEAEARLAAEARERQQRAVQKDAIAAYRVELERQAAQAAAAAAEAERQAALLAEQQALVNRERVEVRQAEYLEKQEKAKERQEAAQAEAEAREARLARLRALVAPSVEADPQRVLAPTAASAATTDKVEGAFHNVNGYTTDQVVKDQRFKVMEALAAVGLHETDYGRRVIAAARPAKLTRPDNFTTEQREAMTKR